MHIPSEEEIKTCIHALHPLKAPGLDGFPRIFYRHYWDFVRGQVISFVHESFRKGEVTKGLNKSFIVLISKQSHATQFSHFCPISLCNFKIISKILTTRLKTIIPKLISHTQGAFVEDGLRTILFLRMS